MVKHAPKNSVLRSMVPRFTPCIGHSWATTIQSLHRRWCLFCGRCSRASSFLVFVRIVTCRVRDSNPRCLRRRIYSPLQ